MNIKSVSFKSEAVAIIGLIIAVLQFVILFITNDYELDPEQLTTLIVLLGAYFTRGKVFSQETVELIKLRLAKQQGVNDVNLPESPEDGLSGDPL